MNLIDNKNFTLNRMIITKNDHDGRYKVSAEGWYKNEECKIDIPDIDKPNLIVNKQDSAFGGHNCNFYMGAKIHIKDGVFISVTIPRIKELRDRIDKLNSEVDELQNELNNILSK